ncbi:YheC/YheD family protein [Ammoniphilus sp. YIM 78166]|uniref:YheC/YheD family protein n=1 Tax=Ammoniphilus sp. YIM 78166 TaxID=1644106 RepID=UPI0010700EE7|nr:YheC/YheD family protein [Ammoniphilus sp. YIM 78166]
MRRHISSKWDKTKVLLKNQDLSSYIPETKKLTKKNLFDMLDRFLMVYVKPNKGMHGRGVMRVEKLGKGFYRYGYLTKKTSPLRFDTLHRSIYQRSKGEPYLVQQGINLLTFNNQRFDLRVMVQKNLKNQWEFTGIVGRVAQKAKVVTNIHNGGTIRSLSTLLSPHFSPSRRERLVSQLKSIGLAVAKQLEIHFRGLKEVGLDVGVDHHGRPWIIEVNTTPDPYLFRRDKKVFYRIMRYARAYGRV